MPDPIYIECYPPMTTDEIVQFLNRHKYYGINFWEWDNNRRAFGYRLINQGKDNWRELPTQEAADLANKLRAGVTAPGLSRQEVVDSLNRFGIHGHSTWTWNMEDDLFEVPGKKYSLIQLSPEIAQDIAIKHKLGWLVDETKLAAIKPKKEKPTMKPLKNPCEWYTNMNYVGDVLNENKHRGHCTWTWDSADGAFVIRMRGNIAPICGTDAQLLAAYYEIRNGKYGVDPAELAQPLKRKPRLDRTIELVIEADNHLINLADAASGIGDKSIKAQLGVISRMMTLLKHDLRNVEKQVREGQ